MSLILCLSAGLAESAQNPVALVLILHFSLLLSHLRRKATGSQIEALWEDATEKAPLSGTTLSGIQ